MQRKLRAFNTVLLVENETARYQPFINNPLVELVCLSSLARALRKYEGIVLCHFVFLPWGYKMIITGDPSQYSDFMNYFGGELAKSTREMLGVSYEKIWARKFDETILYSPYDVCDAVAKMYLEAIIFGVCKNLNSYGSMSSWGAFKEALHRRDGKVTKEIEKITFSMIEKIPNKINRQEEDSVYAKLLSKVKHIISFQIEPFGWKKCFPYTRKCGKKKMYEKFKRALFREIRKHRGKIREGRRKGRKGKVNLTEIYKRYKPARRNRK
ncbi:MAG: hypothetical protein D6780_04515, partial [Candidatus Dadabacteria bacterium]